ncbi:hypothetical protein MANES_15G180436v8 [Manihot esculenta]|uniref:Uncharacterized protein n=1 Tax=Manihot esculenta TaxID=3983 RepID=A0ACB7GDH6_MANES|nr:hypothetical protein MANES_15G180436v8 [Manihot esculenta]
MHTLYYSAQQSKGGDFSIKAKVSFPFLSFSLPFPNCIFLSFSPPPQHISSSPSSPSPPFYTISFHLPQDLPLSFNSFQFLSTIKRRSSHYQIQSEANIMAQRCKLRKGNSININLENETENNVNQNFQETQELHQNQASNFQGSNTIKRKTRGPTRCLKITQLENGQKLPVEFDEDDQAIGDNATAFVWFLGQIIRSVSCCPLQVKQWNKITDDKLDYMWSTILEKFTFEYSDARKGAIFGHMNALYRNYRHN